MTKTQPENSKMKLSAGKSKLLLRKRLREIFWNIFNRMEIPQRHNICEGSKDNMQAETTNRFVAEYQQRD